MADKTTSSAGHKANRLARLAAVQALYRNSFEQESLAQIVRDSVDGQFAALRDEEDGAEAIEGKPDAALFARIVEGVVEHREDLDGMISGALETKKSRERMETLLLTILRAGTFELYRHPEVPAGAIINDYVDVARAFYNAKEPGLVNAVLDKLAGKLREG